MTMDSIPTDETARLQLAAQLEATPEQLLELHELDSHAINRVLAANPSTPVKALKRIQKMGDPESLRALAGNPQTPVKDLLQLALEHPHEFLRNPVQDFMLLIAPHDLKLFEVHRAAILYRAWMQRGSGERAAKRIPRARRHALFDQRDLLKAMSPWLAQDADMVIQERFLAVELKFVSPTALPVMAKSPIAKIRINVAGFRQTDGDTLLRLADDPHPKVRLTLARNRAPQAEDAHAHLVASGASQELLLELAKNPLLGHRPAKMILELDQVWLSKEMAANGGRDALIFHDILNLRDPTLTVTLAGNPRTGVQIHQRIIEEGDECARLALVGNPNLRGETVETLFTTGTHQVRMRLTHRPGLSHEILRAMAASPNPELRHALAKRLRSARFSHNTPFHRELLQRLADDEDERIVLTALADQRMPRQVLQRALADASAPRRKAVARNPALPPAQIAHLMLDAIMAVRQTAFRNALDQLAHAISESEAGRFDRPQAVLWHDTLTGRLCQVFRQEPRLFLEDCVQHRGAPAALLDTMIETCSDHDTWHRVSSRNVRPKAWVLSDSRGERHYVSANKLTDPATQQAFLASPHPFIRGLIAGLATLPAKARDALNEDPAPYVRFCLARTAHLPGQTPYSYMQALARSIAQNTQTP